MSAPSLSVVVLTYNSAASLPACLTALQGQLEELGGDLVVVDNASADDTLAVARSLGVEPVTTGENLGFARGCAVGVAHARGELIVLVNPDAVLDVGALAAFRAAANEPRRGPIGGRAHDPAGGYDPRAVLGRPSVWGAWSFALGVDRVGRGNRWLDPEHGPARLDADGSVVPVPAVSGACLAVPRRLWDALGGFDPRYFLYGEDLDLSLRARAAGWTPCVATAAGYEHVGGASSSSSELKDVLLYRGKVELYRQHLRPAGARAAIIGLQLGVALRAFGERLLPSASRSEIGRWTALQQARSRWRVGYPAGDEPGVGT